MKHGWISREDRWFRSLWEEQCGEEQRFLCSAVEDARPCTLNRPPFLLFVGCTVVWITHAALPELLSALALDPFSGSAHRHLIAGFSSPPSPGDDGATDAMRRCDGGWWWRQNTTMMPQWCHDAPSGCWWCWSWVILIYPTLIDMALLAALGLGWNFGLLVILDLFDLFSLSLCAVTTNFSPFSHYSQIGICFFLIWAASFICDPLKMGTFSKSSLPCAYEIAPISDKFINHGTQTTLHVMLRAHFIEVCRGTQDWCLQHIALNPVDQSCPIEAFGLVHWNPKEKTQTMWQFQFYAYATPPVNNCWHDMNCEFQNQTKLRSNQNFPSRDR